ncbi:hypothetical protein LH464_11490 [Neorhizobium sp. T786]|uniref:hypothetical protein n=1 Tax=Pseudorhizobium xiangyangii TaxID=2883104 RepID=UPI001CFF8284|nr:hypothetical protein [Neorhizobium xiangyangii]MCB5203094.1 hypothetical protein [Neorhizobium xiangyangii]
MILEAIQYAASYPVTPTPFRPHIRSSVSLWSRARRCARDWAEHEENCRRFVQQTIAEMKQRRTVVVLGSGLLRDVPVELLSRAFDTVVLVDLVHLASVRLWLKAKGLRNVRLISRDLSGFEDAVAGKTPEPLSFLRQVPYLDLVISTNLLTQIGVGIERRLEKEGNQSAAEVLPQVISAHLGGLAGLPCRTVLVTDTSYTVVDRGGNREEEGDLLHGVPAPMPQQDWLWPVVPFGEESRDYRIDHRVVAIRDLR